MTNVTLRSAKRLLGALGLLLGAALLPTAASAGVATAGAVLLDPFDPVPAIQFHHFGGYGCYESCGGYNRCDDGCGGSYRSCDDGCGGYRHRHRERCDDGCRVAERHHHDCDRECDDGRDGDRGDHGDGSGGDRSGYTPPPPPCPLGHCSDFIHWERHWRQGDHVGQQWYDSGFRQRELQNGTGSPQWYGRRPDPNDDDEDVAPPPPPPPAADTGKPDKHGGH